MPITHSKRRYLSVSLGVLALGGVALQWQSGNAPPVTLSSAQPAPVTGEPAEPTAAPPEDLFAEGRKIAFDRKRGNCLACHAVEAGESPGNIGPPLVQMKTRFPEREMLRAQIWNPQSRNPESSMPPFGRHGIISEKELEKVVDYIWSL